MRSWEIGKPFGIKLAIHWSFWLLPAIILLGGVFSGNTHSAMFDVVVMGALFGCVALHELGHALAARGFGIRTHDIELYPIGGVARLERIPSRPIQEIAIALAGPAVNVAIAVILGGLMLVDGYSLTHNARTDTALEFFCQRVLWGNIILAAFNLLPAFPMDGGRVLRATMAMFLPRVQATSLAVNVSMVFALLFVIWAFVSGNFMLAVLAYFLYTAGQQELQATRYDAQRPQARPFRMARPISNYSGWVWRPEQGVWVEYRMGIPVQIVQGRA